jgi:hypothetical protein
MESKRQAESRPSPNTTKAEMGDAGMRYINDLPDEFVCTDPVSLHDFEFERLEDDEHGSWYGMMIDGEAVTTISDQMLRALLVHGLMMRRFGMTEDV